MRGSVGNLGLALALLSSATFGTSGSFASSLIAAGWSPGAAVTARVVIAAVVLTGPALLQLRARRVTPAAARTVALYGVASVAIAQLCYFNAVAHLPVAVALLLEYSGILLVIAWGRIRHGHRVRWLTIAGGIAAVIGLVLALDLVGSARVDLVGVLWGFGAAVGLATYFIIAAEADHDVPALVMAWGGLVIGALVIVAAGVAGAVSVHVATADVVLVHRQVSWIVPVLGLAIIAAVIPYLAGIASVRLLGSKLASFVGLTEVLFAVLFAWLLLGQRLHGAQLVGAALVIAGIALVRLDEMRGMRSDVRGALAEEPVLASV